MGVLILSSFEVLLDGLPHFAPCQHTSMAADICRVILIELDTCAEIRPLRMSYAGQEHSSASLAFLDFVMALVMVLATDIETLPPLLAPLAAAAAVASAATLAVLAASAITLRDVFTASIATFSALSHLIVSSMTFAFAIASSS